MTYHRREMVINKEVLKRAEADLSRRKGIPVDKIMLKDARAVVWPDSSLGCPRPGRMYAQVATPGYQLLLSDGSTDFEYHTDNHKRVVFFNYKNGAER